MDGRQPVGPAFCVSPATGGELSEALLVVAVAEASRQADGAKDVGGDALETIPPTVRRRVGRRVASQPKRVTEGRDPGSVGAGVAWSGYASVIVPFIVRG